MPSLNLIGAYYFDYAQNVTAAGDNGMRNSILASADYFFTKDVDVYLAGWWTVFSGALANTKNGGDVALNDSNAGTPYPLIRNFGGQFHQPFYRHARNAVPLLSGMCSLLIDCS